ncbi:hypothetical protein BD560DRAFT_381508 [Blakeslea trispora]|nr:hypothetical protein BD560DRAFT_381508 [Blakeslea trispora]
MKLSYSVLLLAAFAGLQAYAAPGSSTCISGSAGLAKGDGYKGYCCEENDDCYESCISGVCNGPSAPSNQPGTGTCTPGSSGLGKGNGYKGYCCKNSDDCYNSCVSGVCNGASKPSTTSDLPGKPTTSDTPGKPNPSCLPGSYGLGNGDGYKGDCCKNSDDCRNACVSGVCNGASSPGTPGPCKKGYQGLGNGKGPVDACCDDSDDCQEACVRGRCTAP